MLRGMKFAFGKTMRFTSLRTGVRETGGVCVVDTDGDDETGTASCFTSLTFVVTVSETNQCNCILT